MGGGGGGGENGRNVGGVTSGRDRQVDPSTGVGRKMGRREENPGREQQERRGVRRGKDCRI